MRKGLLFKTVGAILTALFLTTAAHGLVLLSVTGNITQIPLPLSNTVRLKATTRVIAVSMTPSDVGTSMSAVGLLREFWGVSCNSLVRTDHCAASLPVQGVGQILSCSVPSVGFKSVNCNSRSFNMQGAGSSNAGSVLFNGMCEPCCV